MGYSLSTTYVVNKFLAAIVLLLKSFGCWLLWNKCFVPTFTSLPIVSYWMMVGFNLFGQLFLYDVSRRYASFELVPQLTDEDIYEIEHEDEENEDE